MTEGIYKKEGSPHKFYSIMYLIIFVVIAIVLCVEHVYFDWVGFEFFLGFTALICLVISMAHSIVHTINYDSDD